jgi:hypothetical protein
MLYFGATTNEILFVSVQVGLVLLGAKIGKVGEVVARAFRRR